MWAPQHGAAYDPSVGSDRAAFPALRAGRKGAAPGSAALQSRRSSASIWHIP